MTVPIFQAPIGSACTPELAAAVGDAGGLGSLALTWTDPGPARAMIRRTRALTDRPFAANFVLDFPIEAQLDAALSEGVRVISTFWGDSSHLTAAIHEAGALHVHTVGSTDEAVRAVAHGVDAVVAQGWEAGGHVRGSIATLALVPAVVDAVTPVPVLAAGGVCDGRALAAVLALGAEAAWIGTRFLLAEEANTHDLYRAALLDADESRAVYGTIFDVGWPAAPHRALANSTTRLGGAARGHRPRPGEGVQVATDAHGRALVRYSDSIPTRGAYGDVEALAMYAGQGVGRARAVLSASAIVAEIAEGAARALAQVSSV